MTLHNFSTYIDRVNNMKRIRLSNYVFGFTDECATVKLLSSVYNSESI
jgi:hypothetical protein